MKNLAYLRTLDAQFWKRSVTGLLFIFASGAPAAVLLCEIGTSNADGSNTKIEKSEQFKLDSEVLANNQTNYLTLEDNNLIANIVYFASQPDISIIDDKQITSHWVVTVEIRSKQNGDLIDLKTEVITLGSDAIRVFDSNKDDHKGIYASCIIQ